MASLELIDRDQWVPDSDCKDCLRCKQSFTPLRRRHHCRKCGLLVCGQCSSQRAPTHPDIRLCDQCYDSHMQRVQDDGSDVKLRIDIPPLELSPKIPLLVRRCLQYLSAPSALKEEGLFRVPGSKTEVMEIYARFESGEDVDLTGILDPATVCGVFKMYLMHSTHPPFPTETSKALHKPFAGPADLRIASLKKQIESLDGWQQATLRAVITLLQKIVLQPDNLMTPPALGTSLGMTLFQGLSVNQATELLVVLLGNEQLYAELEE